MKSLHTTQFPPSVLRPFRVLLGALVLAGLFTGPIAAEELPPPKKVSLSALEKTAPEGVEDLKAIQEQVKKVLKEVMPATVGIRAGGASGSGVIIDREGHVLTAGHVSGEPDREVKIILPDGKTVTGKTLGANRGIDSGMIKITEKGDWPYVKMGNSSDLKKGQWVIATGHPGGFRPGRTPVVRVGRVLETTRGYVRTDCALVGGDSGGPLFDLEGRVVGIHSRIGREMVANLHVPVDTYADTWDRLVAGESWGGRLGTVNVSNAPYVGIVRDEESEACRIAEVMSGSPAEKAGLRPGDVIARFDGQSIDTFDDLISQLRGKKVGDTVVLEVQRGSETMKLELVLGRRPNE